jgi:hypothetical protein
LAHGRILAYHNPLPIVASGIYSRMLPVGGLPKVVTTVV